MVSQQSSSRYRVLVSHPTRAQPSRDIRKARKAFWFWYIFPTPANPFRARLFASSPVIQIINSNDNQIRHDFAPDNPTNPNLSIAKSGICDTNSWRSAVNSWRVNREVSQHFGGSDTLVVGETPSHMRCGECSFGGEGC